jgi:DNA replication initiation complex subunit (GINS family)
MHFRDEDLDSTKLYKIQWKERNQIAGQISKLPEGFYPKLRRYLIKSKDEIKTHPEKVREYNKAKDLAWDIVNSRLKKIVTLSSGLNQTNYLLKQFTNEERFFYQELGQIINNWKEHILNIEGAI